MSAPEDERAFALQESNRRTPPGPVVRVRIDSGAVLTVERDSAAFRHMLNKRAGIVIEDEGA